MEGWYYLHTNGSLIYKAVWVGQEHRHRGGCLMRAGTVDRARGEAVGFIQPTSIPSAGRRVSR
jgi:hypothetical protein